MTSRLRTVVSDLGRMLQALSGMMLLSVVIPIVWEEYYVIPGILLSGGLSLGVGLLFTRVGERAELGKLHGMMIAALGWFLVALFGSVPFLSVAWTVQLAPSWVVPATVDTATLAAFRNPINSVFESMSGFTGTGLTMTAHENKLPHTLQWWRSFTEWIGGVGVIVLTTAILSRPGSGSLTLYESEARSKKIHPSVVSTVRTIWWIFLLFTFLSISLLWLAGMPIWDAINHAMTGLSTGGFSVTDNSIATYQSPVIEFALIPVMILGSIAFPIHYLMLRGDLHNVYRDLQTRWVFIYFTVGSVGLIGLLQQYGTYDSLFQSVRFGLFQFVSAASCTGFQTAGIGETWSPLSQLTVAFGMFVGASAGSTVGGIKLIRLLTIGKGMAHRISDVFYPSSAIRRFEIDGRILSDIELTREFEEAGIITLLWLVFLAVGIISLLLLIPPAEGFTLANVVFEVASAQGNVGLSTGITSATMPVLAKILLIFNMWIGRLEIIPVLVLLRAALVRGDRP
ncbi:TrkH family potassium uptake protein [Halocatena pleomorpha]|uniref:TrkH family potassium uptake protein n=1 Tax=Halocatena pleomorpha TaxID=1785090 RepID=A0A3P3RA90_9EURY|nr:TrkH family potassium uptake protein [Halocatena pleomorpha]RRJ30376.1 TrkH family potassium uptake protein [Halocatena pleomorpha]